MNPRSVIGAALLTLAIAGCATRAKTEASSPAAAPAAAAKDVCQHDADCAPYHSCTSDHHCRCEVDGDCAATQACRAGLCMPR
jgi:outer membrane murein-binding lipoprotein Lpp